MNDDDAQQLLRQQIAFTRKHIRLYEQSKSPVDQYASLQASILCLDIGLSQYFCSLFKLAPKTTLTLLTQEYLSGDGKSIGGYNYKQKEVLGLYSSSTSWLVEFQELVKSARNNIVIKKSQPSQGGGDGLIATSVRPKSRVWWERSVDSLSSYADHADELLEHHTSFDQEY